MGRHARRRRTKRHIDHRSSHRAHLLGRGYRDLHLDPQRVRYRRSLALCAMTLLVPGSAQVALGRKVGGYLAMTLWVAAVSTLGWLLWSGFTDPRDLLRLATNDRVLRYAQAGLVVVAIGWLGLFVDAFRLGRPFFRLRRMRTLSLVGVNVVVVVLLGASTVVAAQTINAPRAALSGIFSSTEVSEPLHGRYNILLIGSDSGSDRFGMRPDSLTVVSIDADSGRTVLVSLPRNLQNVPFPDDSPMHVVYPAGYNCGPRCLLNAVHTAAADRTDLYPGSADPGLDATIDAVEGATGLTMNYHVLVNMSGFAKLIDAMGGLEVDVRQPIARFGSSDAWKGKYPQYWIEPGVRTLRGKEALWYGRSRYQADDYTRMGRQKCLMVYMLEQLSPTKVLWNSQEIAASSSEMMSTDIPASDLPRFVELAQKARGNTISTVSLVPPKVSVTNPDFAVIHQMIADAIAGPRPDDATAAAEVAATAKSGVPELAGDAKVHPRSANQAADLGAEC